MKQHLIKSSIYIDIYIYIVGTVIILAVCAACQNHLLPAPTINNGQTDGDSSLSETVSDWGAPAELQATHGQKQSISLSWKAVKGAARYFIYQAATPYDTFIQIAETAKADTSYTLKTAAGTDMYYRVTAVNQSGKESPFSATVRGTSLAQPIISDIEGDAEDGDTTVTVYWYMNNVSKETYLAQVQYNIICQDATGKEIAKETVSGADTSLTQVKFAQLTPNTTYKYQVQAFLSSDTKSTESSDFMDAATARRLRPMPVSDVTVSQGTAVDKVSLTFTLPEMVDTLVSNGLYEQTPLYFMIYRREKAAGTQAADFTDGLICAKFDKTAFPGGEYIPGTTVTYEDTRIVRGIEYEYLIQSYSDAKKPITSDRSAAQTANAGWAISKPTLTVDQPQYTLGETLNSDGEQEYSEAQVHLSFSFDAKGISTYIYRLRTFVELIGDGFGQLQGELEAKDLPLSELADYTTEKIMLPNQRGRYSYSVEILNAEGTVLDTARMIGSLRITEETAPLVVENFTAEDGYKDKIILRWNQYVNVGYYIDTLLDDKSQDTARRETIPVLTDELPDGAQFRQFTYELTEGVLSGKTYYIKVTPFKVEANTQKPGIETISDPVTLLGEPELETAADYQYDHISLKWKQVPKADNYRIIYQYTDTDSMPQTELTDPTQPDQKYTSGAQMQTALIPASGLNPDPEGIITYKFKPAGYDDARFAGRELSIKLQAINTERCADPSAPDIQKDSSAIAESKEQRRKQIGPAMTGLTASHAEYGDKIELKWNKVEGAAGYLIYRIQKDLTGLQTQSEEPLPFYYDADSNTVKGLQLKDEGGTWADSPLSEDAKTGTITIKAHDTYYAIQDLYKDETWHTANKTVYKEQFANEQYEMAIGYPYTYLVLPVISSSDTAKVEIDFSLGTCTIGNAVWNNAAAVMQTGYTLGLPKNIRGSKGWGATEKKDGIDVIKESTHVTITWEPPTQKPENPKIRYQIWRTPQGQNTWKKISGDEHITKFSWDDESAEPGIVYEYAVSTWTATAQSIEPASHPQYLSSISTVYDKEAQGMFNNTGYKLGRPVIDVSRDEQKQGDVYAEKITWSAGGNEKLNTAGYLIEVRNNNIDDQWHEVNNIDIAANEVKTTNEFYVTAADAAKDGTENILKVLRDYKHYYRIRAYITRDGEKIYSEIPVEWSEGVDTDNMTWGARQITAEEMVKAATLAMSEGMYRSWDQRYNEKWSAAAISGAVTNTENAPGSGTSIFDATGGGLGILGENVVHNTVYTNYTPALTTKSGITVTFLTINGKLTGETWNKTAINPPTEYHNYEGAMQITGPVELKGLYTTQILFNWLNGDPSFDAQTTGKGIKITYPAGNTEQIFNNITPLPFNKYQENSENGFKQNSEEWGYPVAQE